MPSADGENDDGVGSTSRTSGGGGGSTIWSLPCHHLHTLMNCKGRAEAFAKSLQSKLRYISRLTGDGSDSSDEEESGGGGGGGGRRSGRSSRPRPTQSGVSARGEDGERTRLVMGGKKAAVSAAAVVVVSLPPTTSSGTVFRQNGADEFFDFDIGSPEVLEAEERNGGRVVVTRQPLSDGGAGVGAGAGSAVYGDLYDCESGCVSAMSSVMTEQDNDDVPDVTDDLPGELTPDDEGQWTPSPSFTWTPQPPHCSPVLDRRARSPCTDSDSGDDDFYSLFGAAGSGGRDRRLGTIAEQNSADDSVSSDPGFAPSSEERLTSPLPVCSTLNLVGELDDLAQGRASPEFENSSNGVNSDVVMPPLTQETCECDVSASGKKPLSVQLLSSHHAGMTEMVGPLSGAAAMVRSDWSDEVAELFGEKVAFVSGLRSPPDHECLTEEPDRDGVGTLGDPPDPQEPRLPDPDPLLHELNHLSLDLDTTCNTTANTQPALDQLSSDLDTPLLQSIQSAPDQASLYLDAPLSENDSRLMSDQLSLNLDTPLLDCVGRHADCSEVVVVVAAAASPPIRDGPSDDAVLDTASYSPPNADSRQLHVDVHLSCGSASALTSPNSEDDRPRRVRRCSSLKTGKTPPGTPHRKKIVSFADALGLDLADIRTIFLDDLPNVPSSAFDDLQAEHIPPFAFPTAATDEQLVLQEQQLLQHPPQRCTLVSVFPQPASLPDFGERLRRQSVCLESATVSGDTNAVRLVIRVLNLDFRKVVTVRYTRDEWRTHLDLSADYAGPGPAAVVTSGEASAASDRFSTLLLADRIEAGERLCFAVCYTVLGAQYWDSNDGLNYIFQCYPESVPSPLAAADDSWIHFL